MNVSVLKIDTCHKIVMTIFYLIIVFKIVNLSCGITICQCKIMEIKDRFLQIISRYGLSQQEMAERIGVDASTVSYFCKGKRKPGFDILEKIAKAFPDVDLNWLVAGDGDSSESHISSDPYTNIEIEDSRNGKDSGQLLFDFSSNSSNSANTNKSANVAPKTAPSPVVIPAKIEVPQCGSKKIKRVIILFEDGTMESYNEL